MTRGQAAPGTGNSVSTGPMTAKTDTPKRGNSAFVIGCVLGLVFIGGGLLVVAVGGGFAAAYLWTPGAKAPESIGLVSVHNPGAKPVDVKCSGNGIEAAATVAPGETAVISVAGVPVECAGRIGEEEVWEWSADDGTAWSVDLPASVGDVEAVAVDPNALPVDPDAAPVDPNAPPVDPNAAPVDPAAAPTDATTTSTASTTTTPKSTTTTKTTKTTTKPSSTSSTTAAPAAEPEPAPAPAAAPAASTPTKITVDFSKKAKKMKGIAVAVDGKSIGTVPTSTEVQTGMHTITVKKDSINLYCSIAASGKAWTLSLDPDAPACP